MTNTAQIGTAGNSVDVRVAHQSCPKPADSTYPRVCNQGEVNEEPIDLSNSAHIYGNVQATNQTDGAGMSNPGLQPGTVEPALLPSHDRLAQKAAITKTITSSQAECAWPSKTGTWDANTKIIGDVNLSNKCTITVKGDIWITGSLSLSNSSELRVDNSLTEPPVVMVDGKNGVNGSNGSEFVSNSQANPIGFRVITYWSNAGCSPDCDDVKGVALESSRNVETINMSNRSAGPNTEFYARWSKVGISNAGSIGAVVGQTVKLSNSSAITFGTKVGGTGGGGSIEAWVVESYRRVY
jgi:hypothetical protein